MSGVLVRQVSKPCLPHLWSLRQHVRWSTFYVDEWGVPVKTVAKGVVMFWFRKEQAVMEAQWRAFDAWAVERRRCRETREGVVRK